MRKEIAFYTDIKRLNKIRLNLESKLYKCNLDSNYIDEVTSDLYKHIVDKVYFLLSKVAPTRQFNKSDAEEFVDVLQHSKSYKEFCLIVYGS